MKIQIVILLSILLKWSTVYSQNVITGKVIDNETKQGIAFASIVYLDGGIQKGSYTDSLGNYSIKIFDSEITISCIGYKTQSINFSALSKEPVLRLNPLNYKLDPIEIKPHKIETKRLGYFEDKIFNSPVMSEGYRGTKELAKNHVAQYIANSKNEEGLLITKLLFNLSNHPNIKRNGKPYKLNCANTRIRLHLFSVNEISGLPDKELLTKNILIINDCERDNLIQDITDQNIFFPINGIFVGLEYVDVLETKAISLFPFYIFNYKKKSSGSYNSFHETNWTSIISNNKIKFNIQFGIEVVK